MLGKDIGQVRIDQVRLGLSGYVRLDYNIYIIKPCILSQSIIFWLIMLFHIISPYCFLFMLVVVVVWCLMDVQQAHTRWLPMVHNYKTRATLSLRNSYQNRASQPMLKLKSQVRVRVRVRVIVIVTSRNEMLNNCPSPSTITKPNVEYLVEQRHLTNAEQQLW